MSGFQVVQFVLQPFPIGRAAKGAGGGDTAATIRISGAIERRGQQLQLSYELDGDLQSLVIPATPARPERRDHLWQGTCLELFLGRPGDPAYWEFNLSPAGHWNVYRLEGYRQGLRPEPAYQDLPFHLELSAERLSLQLQCPLPPGLIDPEPGRNDQLEAGLSAVLLRRDGEVEYWALCHPSDEPDFHRRDGFALRLP